MAQHSQNEPIRAHFPEASHLLKGYGVKAGGNPVGEIEVRPTEQLHMSLGVFRESERLRGFTTELTPDPEDDNAIVTRVARVEREDGKYELIFHIANYGNKTISAEIKRL